jgi:hypothetical protein
VNAVLLNEFLKEHREVEELKSTVAKQEATISQLKSTVAKQEATGAEQQKGNYSSRGIAERAASQIQKVSAQLEVQRVAAPMVINNP